MFVPIYKVKVEGHKPLNMEVDVKYLGAGFVLRQSALTGQLKVNY